MPRSLPPMMSISRARSPCRAKMRNSSGWREGTALFGWAVCICGTVPRRILLGPISSGAPPESERRPRRSSMAAVCSRRLCPRLSTRVGTVSGLPTERYLSQASAAFWAKAVAGSAITAGNAIRARPVKKHPRRDRRERTLIKLCIPPFYHPRGQPGLLVPAPYSLFLVLLDMPSSLCLDFLIPRLLGVHMAKNDLQGTLDLLVLKTLDQ